MNTQRLIIGISGASGAVYGIRALQMLREAGVETHLVISRAAQITIAHETPYAIAQVQAMADHVHNAGDLSAPIASGSFGTDGMLVAPCSMRTLAEIALGLSTTLLSRAADVTLKERRRLVLMPRETPLNAAHVKNMLAVTEMGGIIAPPVPAFYTKPQTLEDVIDSTTARALSLFGIECKALARWEGIKSP